MGGDHTSTYKDVVFGATGTKPEPVVLVAHAPSIAAGADRLAIGDSIVIGRDKDSDLAIRDANTSRNHLSITSYRRGCKIQDLGSKNGTYLNGKLIKKAVKLPDRAIIRAGNTILVFLSDGGDILSFRETENFGIAGRFHAAVLARKLLEGTMSGRSLLLAGPSGTGKELAAHAFAEITGKKLVVQNAARFSSEEEAAATLFGVGQKVFSNVDARPGYIEKADKGVLFLDEAHNLPKRVQKSLLRVIEDRELAHIGETQTTPVDVRFLFASNEPAPSFSLERDLLARLRVVAIPPLSERPADIPSIFDHVLTKALERTGSPAGPVLLLLTASHYESLMLDGFKEDNVRGLMDIADRIATRIASGTEPSEAIFEIFSERYKSEYPSFDRTPDGETGKVTEEIRRPASVTEDIYMIVEDAYRNHAGNVSAIERHLRDNGIHYSRRRISGIMDELNLPRVRKG